MKFALIFLFHYLLTGIAAGQDLTMKPIWSNRPAADPVVQISSGYGRIFIPMPNGVLEAIESDTGNIAWKIELGGEFSDTVKIGKYQNSIFVLNEKLNDGKKLLTVRAISPDTGIVRWQRTIENIESNSKAKLLVSDRINLISTEREIFASDNDTGLAIYSRINDIHSQIVKAISGYFLFEIRNLRNLMIIDLSNRGNERRIFESKNEIRSKIFVDGTAIYFSDILGNIFSFDLTKNRISWQTRVGAEVLDIDSVSDSSSIFVVSKDIFFYQLNKLNGNKTRKLRLDTSSFGEFAQIRSPSSLVLSFDDEILIIEAKNGLIANRISLTSAIIFPAIVESNTVIVVTEDGIVAYK
jgi:outer membrane protein assembly factor BamB